MFLIDIKSKIYLYKGGIEINFGYIRVPGILRFGSDSVRFFRYQNFEPVRIFNEFRFGLGTTFSGRVRFGSSDSDFLPSPIVRIQKKNI